MIKTSIEVTECINRETDFLVIVMTYKRKEFKALQLLSTDSNLVLTLAVRKEEFESGYYDHLKDNPQINFMLLEGCQDAGDTREKINQKAMSLNYKYIVVLDDAVRKIFNRYNKDETATEVITRGIKQCKEDIYSDNIVILKLSDHSQANIHYDSNATQAIIINLDKIKELDLHYTSIAECGFDDFTISFDIFSLGKYIVIFPNICCLTKHWEPFYAIAGGTHTEDINDDYVKIRKSDLRMLKAFAYNQEKHHDVSHLHMKTCLYSKKGKYLRCLSVYEKFPEITKLERKFIPDLYK